MSKEAVYTWRKNTKAKMILISGEKCCICGFNQFTEALEFHHLDPETKESTLSNLMANGRSWNKLCEELQKCILVCANCHRGIHAGHIIPLNISTFDLKINQQFTIGNEVLDNFADACPVCSKKKLKSNKTCSLSCAATLSGHYDWDQYNLEEMYSELKSYADMARIIGCSSDAIRKRMKKLKLGLFKD